MRYKNIETGAVIETPCICKGADWQELTPASPKAINEGRTEPERAASEKTRTAKRTVKRND